GDGEEALAAADRHHGPVDLLITDVVMPRVGGRELADRLAAARPDVRVLFVSGYTDDEVVRRGGQSTEVRVLREPSGPRALARRGRGVLEAGGRAGRPAAG